MSSFGQIFHQMPPVTKNLIIINVIVWLAMMVSPTINHNMMHYCALHFYEASDFNIVQMISYMFMHATGANITHLLFNMFTLFMFGILLERVLGSNRFIILYMACGIGAAFIQEAVWALSLNNIIINRLADINHTTVNSISEWVAANPGVLQMNYDVFTTIGASGAIYGILLAFGMLFPNRPLYMMFIPVPIKAKWMVVIWSALELLLGMSSANDGVAHFAHLGGMIFGFMLIYYWKKKGLIHGDPY